MGLNRAGRGRGRVVGALTAVLAAPILLAGCGSDSASEAGPGPVVDAPMVADQGPFLQMCGGVGDEEFLQMTGVPDSATRHRNLVGCTWETPGAYGAHGSFSWYRGSPIEREHTIVDTTGRTVRAISLDGHDGYEGRTSDSSLCEVGIGIDDDFFVWSLVLPPAQGRNTCEIAQQLAMKTLERAE